jgi:geranylgeranyl pyrophosphate synthase
MNQREAGSLESASVRERMDELSILFESELGRYVRHCSNPAIPNLHDGMAYALGTDISDPALRGKRIRPLLCLLVCESLGRDPRLALPFALSIELMHNFALVHDDMEDGDVMRRGRDAAWIRFGEAHAINIGDYLLVHTMRVLADEGSGELSTGKRLKLMQLIVSALDHTHIGQAMDMNARKDRAITREHYLDLVREKTGYYLAAPIQGGAVVGDAEPGVLDELREVALFLGPMFQIIDDIIDLTDGKGREFIGSDICEGKRSFLVAHTSERCSGQERDELFDILDKPRDQTRESDIETVISLFNRYEALEAGHAFCGDLYEKSRTVLARLPGVLQAPLDEVFRMLVNRFK